MFERERTTNQAGGVGGAADAFLGKGTTITGKLVFSGPARIEGRVDGEITAQDVLTIGDGATVNAKVTGTNVIIEGQVTGDVTGRQRLELRASSRVHGNITTASLVIHEGAMLDGQCTMTGADTKTTRDESETAVTHSLDHARAVATQVASALSR